MTIRRIHFAHANGFPAPTYRKLFKLLEPDFSVNYLELHGHDPAYPVTDNWVELTQELIDEIESSYDDPIIGLGHSLGGVLHLLAALERPDLYDRLVLLDAPIISRKSSLGVKLLKRTGLMKRFSPALKAAHRRRTFDSRKAALDHFRAASRFAAFDMQVLSDYIDCGLVEYDGKFRLRFEPEIESEIYATLPHNLPSLKDRLSIDCSYIGGDESREARLAGIGFMKRHFDIEFRTVKGSHLFPLEDPYGTARAIRAVLNRTPDQSQDSSSS